MKAELQELDYSSWELLPVPEERLLVMVVKAMQAWDLKEE